MRLVASCGARIAGRAARGWHAPAEVAPETRSNPGAASAECPPRAARPAIRRRETRSSNVGCSVLGGSGDVLADEEPSSRTWSGPASRRGPSPRWSIPRPIFVLERPHLPARRIARRAARSGRSAEAASAPPEHAAAGRPPRDPRHAVANEGDPERGRRRVARRSPPSARTTAPRGAEGGAAAAEVKRSRRKASAKRKQRKDSARCRAPRGPAPASHGAAAAPPSATPEAQSFSQRTAMIVVLSSPPRPFARSIRRSHASCMSCSCVTVFAIS